MAITSASLPAKKRILTVCVRLFLEKGYKRSTLAEIIKKADVSYSTFQNIFRAKDGVLTELVEFMFSNQFAMARDEAGAKLPPVYVYAVETAIQITLTELNENLREIYIEAYTEKEASEYILRETAKELHGIFGSYLPDATERDFYNMEIGSASIMRGYMAHPCDEELTLEKKLRLFLTMSLRAYNVPKEEVEQVIRFVEGLDIRAIAEQVMQKLFKALAMRYEFSLTGIVPEQ
ncbi:MAG: TetR/AcrR family transcriptional regulator [Firmicutes bacterium]|jgi:AcrR family transcriptional regulator|nr:TetR/AcrR family transcriptional regulator [Bacillota bacterium]